jgi:hypothetical protein
MIEHLKKLKELYTIIVFFISIVISGYQGYNNIINDISRNRTQLETTQITMLNGMIRNFEKNHKCKISDAEWDEYILNYSTLFDLKIKHSILSNKAKWMPIERKINECH